MLSTQILCASDVQLRVKWEDNWGNHGCHEDSRILGSSLKIKELPDLRTSFKTVLKVTPKSFQGFYSYPLLGGLSKNRNTLRTDRSHINPIVAEKNLKGYQFWPWSLTSTRQSYYSTWHFVKGEEREGEVQCPVPGIRRTLKRWCEQQGVCTASLPHSIAVFFSSKSLSFFLVPRDAPWAVEGGGTCQTIACVLA